MDEIGYMKEALKEARKAAAEDEVPVGAVIVKDGKIVARAHNRKEKKNDATAHAEIEAIKKASKKLGWWLEDCDIYVTLEPCAMCAGALVNARLRGVYFGARDPKGGACGSVFNIPEDKRLNHRLKVEGGILGAETGQILTDYFKEKRKTQC